MQVHQSELADRTGSSRSPNIFRIKWNSGWHLSHPQSLTIYVHLGSTHRDLPARLAHLSAGDGISPVHNRARVSNSPHVHLARACNLPSFRKLAKAHNPPRGFIGQLFLTGASKCKSNLGTHLLSRNRNRRDFGFRMQ